MSTRYVCAAIEYASSEEVMGSDVHSDVCPPGCDPANMAGERWRERIHQALDEWLNKSNGTGHFIIGGPDFWRSLSDD
jgi:hypothetical protein